MVQQTDSQNDLSFSRTIRFECADQFGLRGTSGNGVPDHERTGLLSELADDGIDGEATTKQFIGKTTMSRHLKECLDATKDTPKSETEWKSTGYGS